MLSAVSIESSFADRGYICEVKSVVRINDSGTFSTVQGVKELYLGSKFSVNRISGEVVGFPLSSEHFNVSLLDIGSSEWGFKALGWNKKRSSHEWVKYITVKEYSETILKPFWGHDDLHIYGGLCENI